MRVKEIIFTPALFNITYAGFQVYLSLFLWIPAFAGMTEGVAPLDKWSLCALKGNLYQPRAPP
jgi:hypothetical protein